MPRLLQIAAPPVPRYSGALHQALRRLGCTTTELEFTVVTALIGGGTKPQTVDSRFPIRGSAIRGQLRMWWRASAARQVTDRNVLAEEESRLWGSTATQSPVRIRIETTQKGRSLNQSEVDHLGIARGNMLFPVLDGFKDRVRTGIRFKLCFEYPADLKLALAQTLWAWANFGGIGGRTRRGAGAIFSPALALPTVAAPVPLPPGNPQSWPKLPPDYLIGARVPDPLIAWKRAIETYREFRQKKLSGSDDSTAKELGHINPRRCSPMILRPIGFRDGTFAPMMLMLHVQTEQLANPSLCEQVTNHFLGNGYTKHAIPSVKP